MSRYVSIICSVVPLITISSLFFIPCSPSFLISKRAKHQAWSSLQYYRGQNFDITKEFHGIILLDHWINLMMYFYSFREVSSGESISVKDRNYNNSDEEEIFSSSLVVSDADAAAAVLRDQSYSVLHLPDISECRQQGGLHNIYTYKAPCPFIPL